MRDRLLSFFQGGPDHRGRTLDDILRRDDAWLEHTHDFVQWLFPLPERSGAQPDAPVLQAATIEAFAADARLRARLRAALDRMLAFYGLAWQDGDANTDGGSDGSNGDGSGGSDGDGADGDGDGDGGRIAGQGARIVKSAHWQARKHDWFTADTHNNLRLTRILRSLILLGLPVEARALHAALAELARTEPDCGIGPTARRYWDAAVRGASRP